MNEYKGSVPMPGSFYRVLTPEEEIEFRQAARNMWSSTKPERFSVFHPVFRDEWRKLDQLDKAMREKGCFPHDGT